MKMNKKGFTIIEVLIVLAIAGVIILGVLVAVPTLQRNNRNSARTSEASRIASLINQCLANRNGVTGSCDTDTEIGYNSGDFQQISTVVADTGTVGATYFPADTVATVSQVAFGFNRQCSNDGQFVNASTSGARTFTVSYRIESGSGTVGRCIRG